MPAITVRISEALHARVKIAAAITGKGMNDAYEQALKDFAAKHAGDVRTAKKKKKGAQPHDH